MKKNRKRYRMPNWDYRSEGVYFVTICLAKMQRKGRRGMGRGAACCARANGQNSDMASMNPNAMRFFGHIDQGRMILNELGQIAHKFWQEIPQHFPNFYVDEFIVMPDHVHGILGIKNLQGRQGDCQGRSMLRPSGWSIHQSGLGPFKGSLSACVRSFKSAVSRECRQINSNFKWQRNFYERLIRNERSLQNIRKYIRNNPKKCHAQGGAACCALRIRSSVRGIVQYFH